MINILIFRTDSIGELIVTCPTIISIQKYFKECNTTLIASEKNFNYAKNLNIFDQIYKFPRKNIIDKFLLIKRLNNTRFDYIFIFDGKDRSIALATFINSKNKIALSSRIKLFYKISNIKFLLDGGKTNLYDLFQKMLDICDIDTKITNYNFINYKRDNNFSTKIPISKYVHIHLDEKWIKDLYIKSYTNINPDYDGFIELINSISKDNDVLITTGIIDTKLIEDLKTNFFLKVDEKIFHKKGFNKSIYLVYKPSFDDIESLLRKSKTIIACHGSITHAANSFNIKKIDILEESKIEFYRKYTSYLKNYYPVYRTNFSNLKKVILNIVRE